MHVFDTISVLKYSGYIPAFYDSGPYEIPSNISVLQYGPTTEYTPVYTQFEFAEMAPPIHAGFSGPLGEPTLCVSPQLRPPANLSILQRSLWLVNRDIAITQWRQNANKSTPRVFRYNADAQETAKTVDEVVKLHNVAPTAVFECDGIHSSLDKECKCRSSNALPATDTDPIRIKLMELHAAKQRYNDMRPFKDRLAEFEANSTNADTIAAQKEMDYKRLYHNAGLNSKMGMGSMLHTSPTDLRPILTPDGLPCFGHQLGTPAHTAQTQQKLDAAGSDATSARQAALTARSELDDFVAASETAAFAVIGEETTQLLKVVRENVRNGLPILNCYKALYDYTLSTIMIT